MRISDWSSDVCSSDLKGTKKPAGNISGKQDHILVGFDKDVTPKLLPIPSVSDSKKELEKIEPAQPLRSVGREAFISIMYMHEIGLTVDQISDEIQVDRDKIVKVISEGKSLVGDGILQKIDNAIPSFARYISDNEIKRKAVKNYLFGIIVGGFPSQFEKDRDSKKSQKISYIQRQLRKGYDNLKEVKAEDIVENSTQARKEHDTRSYKYDNEAEIPPENLSENKSENLGEALSAIFEDRKSVV